MDIIDDMDMDEDESAIEVLGWNTFCMCRHDHCMCRD